MIVRYTEKIVNLGKREYTVIVPKDIGGFVNTEYIMDGDRNTFQAIVFSLMKLIEHKDTIIYFPLWKNKVAEIMYERARSRNKEPNRIENFDVVFFSHALQFKVHEWKEPRSKLRKIRGKTHKIDFDYDWALDKVTRLNKKFEKTKIHYKDIDNFKYHFRFDTHIFVGGVQSFVRLFMDISEYLPQNFEILYKTEPDMFYVCMPTQCNRKNNYEEPMELGFWDRRYEKEHAEVVKKAWNR